MSKRRNGAEVYPEQQCVGGYAGRWAGVGRPLQLHQTILVPAIVLITEMERCQEQKASGDPAMEDIEALVGDARNKADEVVLTGEEDQERHLGHSKPCRADAESGVVLCAWNVVVDEFESKYECEISQEDENSA